MSSHQIQFQHGMSIPEFLSHFGTEAQCAEALKRSRWPQGFCCLTCSSTQHYLMVQGARKLYQCGGCRLQTSGACQGSCRSGHAASAVLFGLGRDGVLTTTSRSGFKATAPIGSQLRVWLDQRVGLRARAWMYSA